MQLYDILAVLALVVFVVLWLWWGQGQCDIEQKHLDEMTPQERAYYLAERDL